jgi:hypothetical protein
MSLQLSRLERVIDSADGGKQARCPACAELGHDRKGEHLRIYADGRFGCCVHPKDREHRKRIFALAGDSRPQVIRVKVANTQTRAAVQSNVLGRLGRLFESQNGNSGTTADDLGTLGTPFSYLRAHAREDDLSIHKLKEFETGVPSVPADEHDFDCECLHTATTVPSVPAFPTPKSDLPHLLADGTLVIPFSSEDRFHWWKGGQSIAQTRTEVLADGHHAQGHQANTRKEFHAVTV